MSSKTELEQPDHRVKYVLIALGVVVVVVTVVLIIKYVVLKKPSDKGTTVVSFGPKSSTDAPAPTM